MPIDPGTLRAVPPFYVTTPIYYVNDAPHVGHAYTTVNADALARWHRLCGDEVFFLTGTDEHGAKVAEAAGEHGVSPKEWADTVVQRFVDAWRDLDISNDDFIRTTEPRHHHAVQAFLQRIYDNGYIRLDTYRGLYCVSCEDYYTPEQLIDGNCPVHGRPVVEMEEENYFFELSRFEDRLLQWYDEHPEAVRPATKRNEALSFVKGGLKDISITRTSMRWGVPVPWDERHVFYVWYDALVNYLTAIGYGEDEPRWRHWWPAVHHLIGKEIIRFHCVWWPAMCMAAGVDPPAHVFVHGWLLVGGQKLSKTLVREHAQLAAAGGGGPDGAAGPDKPDKEAADAGSPARPLRLTEIAPQSLTEDFGVDATRYHLLRDVPLGTDGDFSYEGLVSRYNADLANNLGNLVARVATVVGTKCGGIGPAPDPLSALGAVALEVVSDATEAWTRFAPHEALEATWRLIGAANAALEAAEPWKAEPGPSVDAVLGDALEVLRLVSVLVCPVMPSAAGEIWRRIGLDGAPQDRRVPADARWGGYPGGVPVVKGTPLFPRRKV
ncbi:MAG: class I tRNA ligase family protein [Actinomycetota bacterium]|nr:class I tRNA ligase family protein [Actinomycetota bacterium]